MVDSGAVHQALQSPPQPVRSAESPSTVRRSPYALFVSTPFLLLAITIFGGVLRLVRLDQPPLWADEAHTFTRVCGTYQQLIDILQYNGFVPLHYELYWWIKQGLPTRFH